MGIARPKDPEVRIRADGGSVRHASKDRVHCTAQLDKVPQDVSMPSLRMDANFAHTQVESIDGTLAHRQGGALNGYGRAENLGYLDYTRTGSTDGYKKQTRRPVLAVTACAAAQRGGIPTSSSDISDSMTTSRR